jgi:Domain of unknown function (DUF4375)
MDALKYTGQDYEWFMEQMCDFISIDDSMESFSQIPKWRRDLYYIGEALRFIMNGGIDSYLVGPSGGQINFLPEILKSIDADKMLKTISAVINLFPKSKVPQKYEERIKCIENILIHNSADKINNLIDVNIDIDIWSRIRNLESNHKGT